MSGRIKGLLIGLAVSMSSSLILGGAFALGGVLGSVLGELFYFLYLPAVLIGFLLSLVFGPIGETSYLFFITILLGQFIFYPAAGYLIGRRRDKKAKLTAHENGN